MDNFSSSAENDTDLLYKQGSIQDTEGEKILGVDTSGLDSVVDAKDKPAPVQPPPVVDPIEQVNAEPTIPVDPRVKALQGMLDTTPMYPKPKEFSAPAPTPTPQEEAGFWGKVWDAGVTGPVVGLAEGLGNVAKTPGRLISAVTGINPQNKYVPWTYRSMDTMGQAMINWADKFPAKSFAGDITRGVAQFLAPAAIPGLGWEAGAFRVVEERLATLVASKTGQWFLTNASAGVMQGLVAFDPHENHISNVVRDYTELDTPILNFLASDKEDSLAEQYISSAIENAGVGIFVGGLFKSLKFTKDKWTMWRSTSRAIGVAEIPAPIVTETVGNLVDALNKKSLAGDLLDAANTKAGELVDADGNLSKLTNAGAEAHALHEVSLAEATARFQALKETAEWKALSPYTQDRLQMHVTAGDSGIAGITDRPITFGVVDNYSAALRSPKIGVPEIERLVEIARTQGSVVAAKEAGELFNFSIMDGSEEMLGMLQGLGKVFSSKVDDVTGGVVSWNTTRGITDRLIGGGPDRLILLGRHLLGATKNAGAIMMAIETFMGSMGEQLKTLAGRIDVGKAGFDELARFQDLTQKTFGLVQLLRGNEANIGRALNFRKVRKGFAVPAVFDEAGLKDLVSGEAGLRRLAKRVAASNDALGALKEASKVTVRGVAYEVFVNGLLSGIKTHIRNDLSNAAVMMWSPIEKGQISLGLALRNGDGFGTASVKGYHAMADRYAAYMETVIAGGRLFGRTVGMRTDVGAVSRRAGDVWADTFTAFKTGRAVHGGIGEDLLKRGVEPQITGALVADTRFKDLAHWVDYVGTAVRMPNRLLTGQDAMFFNLSYMAEITAAARGAAREAGVAPEYLRGWMDDWMKNISPERMKALEETARKVGLENTFQNELGKFGRSIQSTTFNNPWMKFFLPFVRTPANILNWSLTRSPLSIAFKETRAALGGKLGVEQEIAARAKMLSGTAFLGAAYIAASEGWLVGSGPANPKLREAWLADKRVPNSIRVSNGKGGYHQFQFQSLDPIGTYLGVMADAAHGWGDMSEDDNQHLIWTALVGLSKLLANKTYLQGIHALTDALSDPDRNMLNFVAMTANGFVPFSGLLGEITNISTDGATTKDWKVRDQDGITQVLPSLWNKISSRIPWAEGGVPSKYNIFGDPITPMPGVPMRIINPFYGSVNPSPIEKEVTRLVLPISMDRFRQLNGITLTPEQRTKLIQLTTKAGPISHMDIKDEWNKMVQTKRYIEAPEGGTQKEDWGEKRQMISMVFERRLNAARAIMMRSDPDLRGQISQTIKENRLDRLAKTSQDDSPSAIPSILTQFFTGSGS